MSTLFTILILVASVILIISVLLQNEKDPGLSGTLGGGAAESSWGRSKGKSYEALLDKLTVISAAILFISSIALAVLTK
ncbi:protein translocase, SecG subunit [Gottschalkia purinilytica]|uniref:Protein-export membrane protein SecG n=1 Tax=Gottschalkia purinilytica TaxID=1503 RepID=A0A0L0WFA6_GOTPU|nr:preprotein translocase subunit SecG [Gottschalkia purinilytica]KNF10116.1 protein translocase, SecG subunit [Gottschalkia purinilytica]